MYARREVGENPTCLPWVSTPTIQGVETPCMIKHTSHRLTAAINVVATLLVAVLPANAWAVCACGPSGCGTGSEASCCSTQEAEPAAPSCCATELLAASTPQCCCTDRTATACSHSEAGSTAQGGCECLPGRADPFPAQPATPFSGPQLVADGELSLWASVLPTFELTLTSTLSTDLVLHAPPIPFRELYCVWRI